MNRKPDKTHNTVICISKKNWRYVKFNGDASLLYMLTIINYSYTFFNRTRQ